MKGGNEKETDSYFMPNGVHVDGAQVNKKRKKGRKRTKPQNQEFRNNKMK